MATIPSKQLHRAGSLTDLQMNLSDREIGFCPDDGILYIKYGELIPIGLAVDGGDGIDVEKIDGRVVVSLSERNTYSVAGEEPVHGAITITSGAPGTTKGKVGLSNISDIGALVPVPASGSNGKVLKVVADGGELGWDVADMDVKSTDGSVKVTASEVDNKKVVNLELPAKVAAGTYTKVSVNDQGVVTNGSTLSASDVPSLDASKITSGQFGTGCIADSAIVTSKIADGNVTKDKLADGAVGADAIDQNEILLLEGGYGIEVKPSTYGLAVSRSPVSGNFGKASYATDKNIVVGTGSKKVKLGISYVLSSSEIIGIAISIDKTDNNNAWFASATDCTLLCSGIASEDNTAANAKSSVSSIGPSTLGATFYTQLHFYTVGSTPTTYDVSMKAMFSFVLDSVTYVANFDATFANYVDTSNCVFAGCGDVRAVETV